VAVTFQVKVKVRVVSASTESVQGRLGVARRFQSGRQDNATADRDGLRRERADSGDESL